MGGYRSCALMALYHLIRGFDVFHGYMKSDFSQQHLFDFLESCSCDRKQLSCPWFAAFVQCKSLIY